MRRTQRWLKASSFGFVLFTLSNANAVVHIVATVGDPIPNKGDSLLPPIRVFLGLREFNDRGDVVFTGKPSSLANLGLDGLSLYFGNANGFVEIARPGDLAPNSNVKYGGFQLRPNSLSDLGDVVYAAGPPEPNGQYLTLSAVYRWKDGSITTVFQNGDLAPDGNGTVSGGSNAVTNSFGKVAAPANLTGAVGGSNNQDVILSNDGSTLKQVVREGQIGPDGKAFSFIITSPPAINDLGDVAFLGNLSGDTGYRLFRTDGAGFKEIVGYGEPSPRGGTLYSVLNFNFNNQRQAAFSTSVQVDPSDTSTVHAAVFRAGDDGLIELARVLDPVPGGDGIFDDLSGTPLLNSRGQVLFSALLKNTSGGTFNDTALYLGDETGLRQVVREGQLAPNGNGFISTITESLNDSGQICLSLTFRGTSGGTTDDAGIFLWDEMHGLTQVLRKGNSLFGSTLTSINTGRLNNRGDIAFQFSLTDGRSGIAIWSVPEPMTHVLLVAGALVAGPFFARRRCT